jgi:hypothetical protein
LPFFVVILNLFQDRVLSTVIPNLFRDRVLQSCRDAETISA